MPERINAQLARKDFLAATEGTVKAILVVKSLKFSSYTENSKKIGHLNIITSGPIKIDLVSESFKPNLSALLGGTEGLTRKFLLFLK